ncbi:MAG: ExbD/TolR family protein [Candidatus Tectimicrobiota bacterium]
MEFARRRRVGASLNITPLIDVVLLLLIFFMISTTFVVQPGIPIQLPKAVSAAGQLQREWVVAVTARGELYLNEVRVTLKTLQRQLTAAVGRGEIAVLIVKADEAARHGRVVEVMDAAKLAGVGRLAIATATKPPAQP